MFSLRNLFISLLSPAAIFVVMIAGDLIFKTNSSFVPILLVYAQHVYLGEKIGVNLHGGDGWISFPYNGNFLLFNVLLDYFLVALAIYVLLSVFTRLVSPARKLL